MRKVSMWLTASLTTAISLVVMLIFDFLLSLVYSLLEKVPFLSEILDFIGELLDLGLTSLVAIFLITAIWNAGHSIIEKINGKKIELKKSPINYTNHVFLLIVLASLIIIGIDFFAIIKETVTSYTADAQSIGKLLMFFRAVKDTAMYVRAENIILYKLGFNSLVLCIMSAFYE